MQVRILLGAQTKPRWRNWQTQIPDFKLKLSPKLSAPLLITGSNSRI